MHNAPLNLRLLHVSPELDVGGAELMLLRLVRCLDRRGVQSCVVSMSTKGEVGRQLEEGGTEVVPLGLNRKCGFVNLIWPTFDTLIWPTPWNNLLLPVRARRLFVVPGSSLPRLAPEGEPEN